MRCWAALIGGGWSRYWKHWPRSDAPAVLRQVAELDELSPDYAVMAELLVLLQRVKLAQVLPDTARRMIGLIPMMCLQLAGVLAAEEGWQLFYPDRCSVEAILPDARSTAVASRWCCYGCCAFGQRLQAPLSAHRHRRAP
ncbi:MAG: hypothetical protein IPL59_08645 [Candidatus Competibacteraceae bacterium]|nr:hypothetical protein [Candidatus Competibacteraceae bacterium]